MKNGAFGFALSITETHHNSFEDLLLWLFSKKYNNFENYYYYGQFTLFDVFLLLVASKIDANSLLKLLFDDLR